MTWWFEIIRRHGIRWWWHVAVLGCGTHSVGGVEGGHPHPGCLCSPSRCGWPPTDHHWWRRSVPAKGVEW